MKSILTTLLICTSCFFLSSQVKASSTPVGGITFENFFVTCSDNGTPLLLSDDFIIFEFIAFGPAGSPGYSVDVSYDVATPNNGVYGEFQSFVMVPGSVGQGDIEITITDLNNNYIVEFLIAADPGICPDIYPVMEVEIYEVSCHNNETILDPTDDYVVFDMYVEGDLLSNGFTIDSPNGWVSPDIGTYGELDTYQMEPGTAGNGDILIHLADYVYPLEYYEDILIQDPGSCSGNNPMIEAELLGVYCEFNGTADESDDFITFDMVVHAIDIEGVYTVESDIELIPFDGTYEDELNFAFEVGSAGMGDRWVTIADFKYPDISTQLFIEDPGTCSNIVQTIEAELIEVDCNNNDTAGDPSDDYLTVEVLLNSDFPSYGYDIIWDGGYADPFMGFYDENTVITLETGSAGAGNSWLYFIDLDDPGAMDSLEIIDPGSCSFTATDNTPAFAEIEIFPNPASDQIAIDFGALMQRENFELEIYSPEGKLIQQFNIGTQQVLNIPKGQKNGLTFIFLRDLNSREIVWQGEAVWE